MPPIIDMRISSTKWKNSFSQKCVFMTIPTDFGINRMTASFRRRQAPVLTLPDAIDAGESVFVLSGLIPNRKGHPLIHEWFGAVFQQGRFNRIEPIEQVLERTQLGRQAYPNRQSPIDVDTLQRLLTEAVAQLS